MFTDRQSLLLSAIVLMSFVFFGILGILDSIFIAGPIIIGFIAIVVNLFITKRIPETEELEQLKNTEETVSEEV